MALPHLREAAALLDSIDSFLAFPGYPGIAEQFFEPAAVLAFWRRAQAQRFDLALQLHGSGVYANPFALMLGARCTAGFVRPGDAAGGLDLAVTFPQSGPEQGRLMALLAAAGVQGAAPPAEFPISATGRKQAGDLLAGLPRPLIGLHGGSIEEAKLTPPALLAEAALLAQEATGASLVLLGTEADAGNPDQFAGLVRSSVDLRGRTSLPVLGAVIEALDTFVGNDSGPAHIARALDVPSLTLFETTDPERWGPAPSQRHRVLQRPRSASAIASHLIDLLELRAGAVKRRL